MGPRQKERGRGKLIDVITPLCMFLLVVCAIGAILVRDLLYAVIIFGAFSLVMSLVWLGLNAPDIAITEAAAGVGSTALMVAVITRTGRRGT
ncbi:MAG: hydrogenase subunit MbhD domain-containing protein [Bacillota bacterium]